MSTAVYLMPTVDRRVALRIEIPCSLYAAREAGRALRGFLADCALAESELEGWELAAVEAANNAVAFTPIDRRHLPVILEATASPTEVEVRITDHTDGFELPEAPGLPDPGSEEGRGLYLIQILSDRAEYLQGRSANCLVLTKRRAEPLPVHPPGQAEQLEAELALMTEELAASYESLSAIFNFTDALCQAEEPLDLVAPWMKELARITSADWHAFFVVETDGNALFRASADCADLPNTLSLTGGDPRHLAREVLKSRQDFWFGPDTTVLPDDPFSKAVGRCSGFLHPVYLGPTLVGITMLGRHVEEFPFTAGQVNVIHTFADFLGSQIRYAQVRHEMTRAQVLRRELEIAANIQQSLLPGSLPKTEFLDIAGFATSASEVGGDFFDVIALRDGGILTVIADVMGKGVPAALFAAILRAVIRARHDLASQPGRLLEWLNQTLFEDFDAVEMFATVQLAYFAPCGRSLRVSTAGHCPLLISQPGGTIVQLDADGLPIGVQKGVEYPERTASIEPGSRTLLFTDGLIDAQNPLGERLGLPQLHAWLTRAGAGCDTAKDMGESLKNQLQVFREDSAATDDVTFVILASL